MKFSFFFSKIILMFFFFFLNLFKKYTSISIPVIGFIEPKKLKVEKSNIGKKIKTIIPIIPQ
jgi:hypothetical protein